MGRLASKIQENEHVHTRGSSENFTSQVRLNLNDLLKRRKEEKKIDNKNNLIIISSITAVAIIAAVMFSL